MKNKQTQHNKSKKLVSIVLNVLTYIFFFICIVVLVFSITSKKDSDGAVNMFGKQMRVVISNSMEKCEQTDVSKYKIKDIPIKSMVFINVVPEDYNKEKEWYSALKTGDVLTFRYVYKNQVTITHRIVDITEKEGGYIINLEGDNKASDTNTLSQTIDTSKESSNYIIGKVTGQSYVLGLLVTAIKSPFGIISIIIVPCVIVSIMEIIKIITLLSEKKNRKHKEEQKKKDDEINELRRRVVQLEQTQSQVIDSINK